MRDITEILRRFFNIFISDYEVYPKAGVVDSVDESKRTCNVTLLDGGTLEDVKLQTVANLTTGIVVIPTVGEQVMVSFQGKTYGYVSQYSSVAKILIDTQEIVINGGENDGLAKVNELTTKLNAFKNEITAELALISTGIAGAGGAYTPGILSSFSASDYKNTKVKH